MNGIVKALQHISETPGSLFTTISKGYFVLENFKVIYTMRHKFSNFHLIFKMQTGMKMK